MLTAEDPVKTEPLATVAPSHPIVFFDGVCGLCNSTVNFLIARDKHHRLRYAPLQGETAAQRLPESDRADLRYMLFQDDAGLCRKSTAISRILRHLGGVWAVLGWMLWLIPRPLRDFGYSIVAANRYRWFGKHEFCRMPRPEERELFLP